jgi:hypothetical protein
MNKVLQIAFALVFLLCGRAHAQIVITAEDMPKAGNAYYSLEKRTGIETITPGPSGADRTWDFSQLSGGDTTVSAYKLPTDTEKQDFPTCNLVLEDGVRKTFFSIDTEKLQVLGRTDSIRNEKQKIKDTVNVKFNPPFIYTKLPVNFGDTYHTSVNTEVKKAMKILVPVAPSVNIQVDSIHVKYSISKKDTADGWGNVKIPELNITTALRIVSHIEESADVSGYINGAGWRDLQDFSTKTSTIEYSWWAKSNGKELLKIVYDVSDIKRVESVSWQINDPISAVSASLPESAFSLSPNPNDGNFVVNVTPQYAQIYQLSMTDILGVEKYHSAMENLTAHIALPPLPAGIYHLKITSQDGNSSLTKKVLIAK